MQSDLEKNEFLSIKLESNILASLAKSNYLVNVILCSMVISTWQLLQHHLLINISFFMLSYSIAHFASKIQ